MGRSPCCHGEAGVKKGPWTPEEDELLVYYIQEKGHGRWPSLPKLAGLNRCGKSCRLRWMNYLCADIKRGRFTDDEGKLIIQLHSLLGNKWSSIAKKLPGRTDNEIKNYWNTHLRKKLLRMGIDPVTHRPRTDLSLLDGLLAADGSWNFELLPRSSPYGRCAMDFADLDEREGDYTPRLVNSSWINKLLISAYHEKYRVRQPLPGISIVQLGGLGKRALVRHVYRDFDSDIMFQNTGSKTLLCSIVNQVSEQPLNASVASYESIRRKMKDTIDFVLGIDRQDAIRKKGIDMDILWCVVDALAEECNRAKFSDGPNKGRRVVPRRSLARKNRDQKRHDIRAASQKNGGLVSRSEPISADNSSLLTPDSTPERAWRVAAAAPQHMTGYLKHFTNYTPTSGDQVIDTPTMGPMVFHGRGSVNTTNMTLRDVLYVPGLETSLVSTGQLAELGYTIAIGPYGCRVYKDDEGMDLVGKAHYVDGYLLELDFLRV